MTRSEFEKVAALLRTEVLKVCTTFFGNHEDAEDATQEAMMQLWRYCEHIDAGRHVKGLAVRVAKNCCVSLHRRQRGATTAINERNLQHPDPGASAQEQLEAADTRRVLNEVVALLKPRERELFEMRQMEGLSNGEIALLTGISAASVPPMLSAARKKVFQELTKRLQQ